MFIETKSRLAGLRAGRARVRGGLGAPSGWSQYQEQVIERHGNGRYTILLREDHPLTRLRGVGRLGGLGVPVAAEALSAGVSIGTKVATPGLVSATGLATGGLAAGALTAGIGAGVAILVSVLAGLWSAHNARAAGAKDEGSALNSAMVAFDGSMKAIFAAANAGTITGAQGAQYCQQTLQSFWQGMAPHMVGPGRADASHGGNCGAGPLSQSNPCSWPSGPPCNKDCTAGCCVGCGAVYPSVLQAINVFNSPTGGTITVCPFAGSKYGAQAHASYSLTYKPPPLPAPTSVAGVASSVSSVASSVSSSLTTTSVAGIPLWLLLAGGLGIYAVTR